MALRTGVTLKEGRYQIQQLLGQGGFGFVYLAFDWLAEKQVVLKELHPLLVSDGPVLRRFLREGRAMQRLRHPNIVRAEAMFKDHGNHYIVMEYLGAGTLEERMERGRKFSLSRAATVIIPLCDALTYMHQMGVIHCDLNPGNILFDTRSQPKLVDLGIAYVSDKLVHRSWRTERSFAMGTTVYMAPEQFDGVRDDPRVDLYALAAMLYQMLAGRHYLDFALEDTPGVQADNIHLIRHEKPDPIPGIPGEVNEVLLRALSKSPQERYPTVAIFRQKLIQALFSHLSPEKGLSLVKPGSLVKDVPVARPEAADWPAWLWGGLLAINLVAMIVLGVLLLSAG